LQNASSALTISLDTRRIQPRFNLASWCSSVGPNSILVTLLQLEIFCRGQEDLEAAQKVLRAMYRREFDFRTFDSLGSSQPTSPIAVLAEVR